MNEREFNQMTAREKQSFIERHRQQQASKEMRARTIEQGNAKVFEHISQKVQEFTPERWRLMAAFILPRWYEIMWMKIMIAMLWSARMLFKLITWIIMLPIQRRIAKIVWRGGHIARVGQGPSEWIVRIRISKWFSPVYQCDMDIRNGKVTEVFTPTNKKES